MRGSLYSSGFPLQAKNLATSYLEVKFLKLGRLSLGKGVKFWGTYLALQLEMFLDEDSCLSHLGCSSQGEA